MSETRLRSVGSGRPNVGVLALQGDVIEHLHALEQSGARAFEVKSRADLDAADALVVPGGESTTVIRLLERFELDAPVKKRVRDGMPFWGTCMGLIVAAHDVADLDQKTLDLVDVTVRRNAFGRQIASAEVNLDIPVLGPQPFPAVFIRAPWVERAGPSVETLASYEGHPVMVRSGNVLGTSFHPELTGDARVHRYFLAMLRAGVARGAAYQPGLEVQDRLVGFVREENAAAVVPGMSSQVLAGHAIFDVAQALQHPL